MLKLLVPVKASEWGTFTEPNKKLLKLAAAIPINDKFFYHWGNINPINLLYGGYGSGKSVFICLELLRCAMESKYFRCYYGRKVFEDVRGSVHTTLCDVIDDFGLQDYFKYSRLPNGSMDISCVNGNSFHPFGASDIKSLKSIKDPTHFFCEELDQFDLADFQIIYPRLRTTKAITQFYGAFNTSACFDDHWIRLSFFSDNEFSVPITKLFVNYTDNYFINQKDYYAKLELASGGNKQLLEAIANGAWGVQENGNPWLHACDPAKHFKDVPFLPSYPIYISFDFNNDPFACTIRQSSPQMGGANSFIHYIDEIVGQLKVEDTCQIIKARYPASIIYITGDRSGSNEDLGRNQTLYQIIAGLLGLNSSQVVTNTSNLLHSDSRLLLNAMFQHYPNICIDGKCKQLRIDCRKAAVDGESKLPSHLKKDREGFKMDVFDAMRYDFQTFFNDWAKKTYFRVLKT